MVEKLPLRLVPFGEPGRHGELTRLRAEVEARDRQHTAIAELGQAALTGVDPFILLGQACALVELTLAVDHCRAIEITPGGHVIVRASIGSNATLNHCDRDDEENQSLATYVAIAGAPVILSSLDGETRFKCSHLRAYHRIHGGAGIAIPRPSGVFGAVLTYTNDERMFEEHEIGFLSATANLLGEALQRARTEEALRRSESRLTQLIAATLDAVITIDRAWIVIEWNPQAEAAFGVRPRDVIGRPLPRAIIPPSLHEIFEAVMERYRDRAMTIGTRSKARRRMESTARRADGEEFPVEITIDPVGSGEEKTFTAFIRDISERQRSQRELEQRERRFRVLVEKSWSGVALLDENFDFAYVGASTERLLGYREEELIGKNFFSYVHQRESENSQQLFRRLSGAPGTDMQGELRFLHSDGLWVWLEGFAQNLLHDENVRAIVVNYRDVTQRKETEKQLEYQAYYDALTGLPNPLLFRDRVINAIAQAHRNRRGMAVMYLDLDHFKNVNDGLGHSTGDPLLA